MYHIKETNEPRKAKSFDKFLYKLISPEFC